MSEEILTAPELPATVEVVDIQFRQGQKVYYFDPAGFTCKQGDHVIIDTARGPEYGICAGGNHQIPERDIVAPLRSVLRLATAEDEKVVERNRAEEKRAFEICLQKIAEHELDMQLVSAEYAFDGSKVVFYFTSPNRVDFRELAKDLATALHIRIELRQVGTRDETKYLGGIAPCGRVCCCAGNMPEFKKVSVKMAKNQGLSLNPGKISGLCGRLMCCLSYENDYYADAIKKMPKVGSEVGTPEGKAIVVGVNMLKMQVKIKMDDRNGGWIYKDYPVDQIRFKKNNQPEKEDIEEDEE